MSGTMTAAAIVGRLTRDAEMKYTNGGTPICRFSLATNHKTKQGETWNEVADFWDVELWGKAGENLQQYLTKGKQVSVRGPIHQDRWESDGQRHMKIVIKAEEVALLGTGSREDRSGEAREGQSERNYDRPHSDASQTPPRSTAAASGNKIVPQKQDEALFADDIPF
jgi:single-strand DNA-binding protein